MKVINYRFEEKLYKLTQSELARCFLTFIVFLILKHLVFKEECTAFISALVVSSIIVLVYYICRLIKRIFFKYNAVEFSEISLYYIKKGDR